MKKDTDMKLLLYIDYKLMNRQTDIIFHRLENKIVPIVFCLIKKGSAKDSLCIIDYNVKSPVSW